MRDLSVRSRFGGSKVKSGCITCKLVSPIEDVYQQSLTNPRARHVKCDETRPFCQRCVKGGRECGYGPIDSAHKRPQGALRIIHYVVKVPRSSSDYPNDTTLENGSLDFFRNRTSSEIAGCLVSQLWSKFVLQVASSQPAVRHAIIALAALHEQCQMCPNAPDNDFAMLQYSEAVRAVSSMRLDDLGEVLDVALLSCKLFRPSKYCKATTDQP